MIYYHIYYDIYLIVNFSVFDLKINCFNSIQFTTRHSPNILLNQNIQVKNPNNSFEEMDMTAGGSYSIWDFLE